jgi:hypothetical protein
MRVRGSSNKSHQGARGLQQSAVAQVSRWLDLVVHG